MRTPFFFRRTQSTRHVARDFYLVAPPVRSPLTIPERPSAGLERVPNIAVMLPAPIPPLAVDRIALQGKPQILRDFERK